VQRPRLLVHPGGRQRLQTFGEELGFPDMFEWVFDVDEYPAEETIEVAGFALTAMRLPHYTLETYGFRVEADGVSLAYSGDSGPSARLAELARDADLFVCEATLLTGNADGTPRGHLSIEEAVAAYEASGARRLLITHRPGELPVEAGLELAWDGLELDVGR
jgi:ribonuclease BN (tRNA processing enzyme)